ncbi:MAG TPA: pentapeptide repeat-containing protein [Ktedonobacteraceae bacterium]|nr:pentapeptide repeat-containing protein [Ktedonobacteraceae bacterium]
MANEEHLHILRQGVRNWNKWSHRNLVVRPDLSGANLLGASLSGANFLGADLSGTDLFRADLSGTNLSGADLSGANLSNANLSGAKLNLADLSTADLSNADLSGACLGDVDSFGYPLSTANLSKAKLIRAKLINAKLVGLIFSETQLMAADLSYADLSYADLRRADLSNANLSNANLSNANLSRINCLSVNLSGANLSNANLTQATFIRTNLCASNLTGCSVYGVSVWDVSLEGAEQHDLIITPVNQPIIRVDNLEVAQFVYLLLDNPKFRNAIDAITKRTVLILGRFSPERKPTLEALKTALREKGYVPILFDFDIPSRQNMSETVNTLAHFSCFILVDLTDPSCSPYEIGKIAPNNIKPIIPLFQPSKAAQHEFAMLEDLREQFFYVFSTYEYRTQEDLIKSLQNKVIAPAELMIYEILKRRMEKRANTKKM